MKYIYEKTLFIADWLPVISLVLFVKASVVHVVSFSEKERVSFGNSLQLCIVLGCVCQEDEMILPIVTSALRSPFCCFCANIARVIDNIIFLFDILL